MRLSGDTVHHDFTPKASAVDAVSRIVIDSISRKEAQSLRRPVERPLQANVVLQKKNDANLTRSGQATLPPSQRRPQSSAQVSGVGMAFPCPCRLVASHRNVICFHCLKSPSLPFTLFARSISPAVFAGSLDSRCKNPIRKAEMDRGHSQHCRLLESQAHFLNPRLMADPPRLKACQRLATSWEKGSSEVAKERVKRRRTVSGTQKRGALR